jgi:3-oxoacyl-[acyl-carrier-protein] synthase II
MQQEETASVDGPPEQACRPFDRDRTGMVLGEGAAALVLEELEAARARGANIYGEIVARASSVVASPQGVADRRQALENVLRLVLAEIEAGPEDVGHIHAHGISTRHGDADEAQAIAAVCGAANGACSVTAAKSYFGNLGAGSGAVELICSLLALEHGHLFPVLNYTTPDADCPISAVTSHDVPAGDNFVNLSCTPQGQAAAVLVRALG